MTDHMDKNKKRSIFSGLQIATEQGLVKDQAVIIEDDKIVGIVPASMVQHHLPAQVHQFPENYYLVPGFIDLHVHGAKGKDVMDGTEEALTTISHTLAEEGVTGYLPTTMTAKKSVLDTTLSTIANVMADQPRRGAKILGVHLEGPFLSKEKRGAQHSAHMQPPTLGLLQHWQQLSKEAIKLVTLAPELPGAMEFIQTLRRMNIIASVGHTAANYQQVSEAIKAGCTQATHLFNAMSGIHQREPGAAGTLLTSDLVTAEIIVDGVHLHPIIVDMIYKVKGHDRLLLVTDAMRAKCMGDGSYEFGGQSVHVNQGRATTPSGALAGSTLRMPQALKNFMEFTRCSLAEALRTTSYVPARVLGLLTQKGTITVGKDADLVVLNNELMVQMTIREGEIIFSTKTTS